MIIKEIIKCTNYSLSLMNKKCKNKTLFKYN